MPAVAKKSVQLPLTESVDIGQVSAKALENLKYVGISVSQDMRSVVASYNFRDPRTHTTWNYEYKVRMEWEAPGASGVQMDIEVSESKYSGNHSNCKQRVNDLAAELERLSKRFLETKASKPKDTRYGSASWATPDELLNKGYIVPKDKLVDGQWVLAPWDDAHYLVVPPRLTPHHITVRGATGVGKSTGFYEPNLILQCGTSAIVTEATIGRRIPALFEKTAGYRASKGHKIFYFNPVDLRSTCINPIDTIRFGIGDEKIERVEAIADVLMTNTESKESRGDQAFTRSEKILLVSLIAHAAACDPAYGHFGGVRWLLGTDEKDLERIMDNSPWDFARQEFKRWRNLTQGGYRYGVMGGLLARLNSWLTPTAIHLTSKSSFRQEDLMDGLFTLYLSSPGRRPDLKVLTALVFNFVANLASDYASKHPLMLLLDEFTNFGRIAGIDEMLSLIRKTGVAIALGYQDLAQLEKAYSRAEARIIDKQPGSKITFKPREYEDAELYSKALGTFTYHERLGNERGGASDRYYARRLMTADELQNMDDDLIVIRTPSTKPLLRQKFNWDAFPEATKMPPPVMPKQKIDPHISEGRYPGVEPSARRLADEAKEAEEKAKRKRQRQSERRKKSKPQRQKDQQAVSEKIRAIDLEYPLYDE